ncbi:MAG: asparagine synthase-related protein [Bacteroidales bacterium]|nr:asparagine synthase-related protein [Bacteroidales bacterium]
MAGNYGIHVRLPALVQGDRMAMANSVEGRYPFLDYRVIEFCSTLPDRFKLNGLNEKYLLKRLMAGKDPGKHSKTPETTIQSSHKQCLPFKRQA